MPSFYAGQKVKWDKVLSSQSLAAPKCAHCGDGSLETHEWILLSIRGTKLPALGNAIYAICFQMPVQIQLSYTLNVCYTVCDT